METYKGFKLNRIAPAMDNGTSLNCILRRLVVDLSSHIGMEICGFMLVFFVYIFSFPVEKFIPSAPSDRTSQN